MIPGYIMERLRKRERDRIMSLSVKRRSIAVDNKKLVKATNLITEITVEGPQDQVLQRYVSVWMCEDNVSIAIENVD